MVDDPLGVDDAVQAAERIQAALLEGGQVGNTTLAHVKDDLGGAEYSSAIGGRRGFLKIIATHTASLSAVRAPKGHSFRKTNRNECSPGLWRCSLFHEGERDRCAVWRRGGQTDQGTDGHAAII